MNYYSIQLVPASLGMLAFIF